MSLYLGNLSSHIHKDDLERVFWRFGRCNIKLKDGYGFAVYDFPSNADKAMRSLQGKTICGERVSLTWSNRQPRGFQRGARSYEPHCGRLYRKLGSKSHPSYRVGIRKQDTERYRADAVEMLDEERSYNQYKIKDYEEENHYNAGKNLPYEGGRVEPDALDYDRWGQHVDDLYDNGVENRMKFDRYEMYHGEDRSNEDDNLQMTYSGGSPTLGETQEKTGGEKIGDAVLLSSNSPKPQLACYHCGRLGHKMRNCPQGNASQWKSSRFDSKQKGETDLRRSGGGELQMTGSKPHEKGRSGRVSISLRWHMNDSKASDSGKYRRFIRRQSSAARKERHKSQRKAYYGGRKHSRRESRTPKRHIKKARTSYSPPVASDYTASGSCSHSKLLKSIAGHSSSSRSISLSSRHSLPSISKSSSTSQNSRSESAKSRRSSCPTSPSLSISLEQPMPSSPNKVVQMKPNGSSVGVSKPESKEVLAGQRQQVEVEGDARSENSKENTMVSVEKETAVSFIKMEDEMNKGEPQLRDGHGNCILLTSNELKHPCTQKVASPPAIMSPESLRETIELQNSGAQMMNHLLTPTDKPDSEAMTGSFAGVSNCMSSEEILKILKYYGLEHSEDQKEHLSIEDYFGCACLWPWEIIYYRRLKKGPISTDNYARRIAQNREFGIVDKCVRSSSGWGELVRENI